jgi:hypothetical protein
MNATAHALRARELLQWVLRLEYLEPGDPIRVAIERLLAEPAPQEYAPVVAGPGLFLGSVCIGDVSQQPPKSFTFGKPVECPQGCFAGVEARLAPAPGCAASITRYRCLKCDTRWPA